MSYSRIHSTAVIDEDVQLPVDVVIGAYTRIRSGVKLGEGAVVGDFCLLGDSADSGKADLIIGKGAKIRSHTVIYAGSKLGDYLETGHHVVIREQTVAGVNLRVGNFSDIEGSCSIGDYCRFHGYAHIGKGTEIGDFVWIYSLVTVMNDPLPPSGVFRPVKIADGVVVCVGSLVMPGAELKLGVFVAAGSKVQGVVSPGAVVSGDSGEVLCHVGNLFDRETGMRHPWMRHLKDSYPQESHARIMQLMEQILENRFSLELTKLSK